MEFCGTAKIKKCIVAHTVHTWAGTIFMVGEK